MTQHGGKRVSIQISKELYEKATKFVEENPDFVSVESLVELVLNELLTEEEEKALTPEEEKVKERLKSLGYL